MQVKLSWKCSLGEFYSHEKRNKEKKNTRIYINKHHHKLSLPPAYSLETYSFFSCLGSNFICLLSYTYNNTLFFSLVNLFGGFLYIYIYLYLFIYLWLWWVFLADRGLSLVVESGSYSPVVVCGLLTVVVSLVVEHGL